MCCPRRYTDFSIHKLVQPAHNGPLKLERRRYDAHWNPAKIARSSAGIRYLASVRRKSGILLIIAMADSCICFDHRNLSPDYYRGNSPPSREQTDPDLIGHMRYANAHLRRRVSSVGTGAPCKNIAYLISSSLYTILLYMVSCGLI
jgi:hypothetical protein